MSSTSPFLASITATASPQGSRAPKRPRGKAEDGSKEEEDPSINKLLLNVSSLLLGEQRTTSCRIGTTLLLPSDHALTIVLTEARESYQTAQPTKDNGKYGPHPWGAPRLLNTIIIFEAATKAYRESEALVTSATQVWGQESLNTMTLNLARLIDDVRKDAAQLKLLEHLVCHCKYRVARGGAGGP